MIVNKLEIDISKLIRLKLPIESYFILWILYNEKKDLMMEYIKVENCDKFHSDSIDVLFDLEYIKNKDGTSEKKYTFSQLVLTAKAKLLFPPKSDVDEWIDIWYDLWPKGLKSAGYAVRTDRESCLKKLKSFQLKYPQYTKGIIIAATKKYLDIMKNKGYAYIKIAPYFINKDGTSMLEGFCNEVFNNINTVSSEEDNIGNNTEVI